MRRCRSSAKHGVFRFADDKSADSDSCPCHILPSVASSLLTVHKRRQVVVERPLTVTYNVIYRDIVGFAAIDKLVALLVAKIIVVVVSAEFCTAERYSKRVAVVKSRSGNFFGKCKYRLFDSRTALVTADNKFDRNVLVVRHVGCRRFGKLRLAAGCRTVSRCNVKRCFDVQTVHVGHRACSNGQHDFVDAFLDVQFAKADRIPIQVPGHGFVFACAAKFCRFEVDVGSVKLNGKVGGSNGLVIYPHRETGTPYHLSVVAGRTQRNRSLACCCRLERKCNRITDNV